jgi:type I restriction enzyme M protein
VGRPLQLNFQASPERLARLEEERAWQGLVKSKKKGEAGEAEVEAGQRLQQSIRTALGSLSPDRLYLSREAICKDL